MRTQHAFTPLLLGVALLGATSGAPRGMRGAPAEPFATEAPALTHAAVDPADSLYARARAALSASDYDGAARLFDSLTTTYPRSSYAGDALYWRAYALYRLGGASNLHAAAASLDQQKSRYPRAATRGDANALAIRVRGELAKLGDESSGAAVYTAATDSNGARSGNCAAGARHSNDDGDDADDADAGDDESDMRVAALNALMQMDADRAMPILKQVLAKRDACSASLRRKAVFLVSQKHTPETEDILLDVVNRDPSESVRQQAVFWLGQVNSERASSALEQIATSSADTSLREKAVFALMQQHSDRGEALVRRLAESNDTPARVRDQAIFWLGQHATQANAQALRDMFNRLNGKDDDAEDVQKKIMFSLSQMHGQGNDEWLLNIATDTTRSDDIRRQALWTAGQAGVPASTMIAMYDKLHDRPIKEQLIWVMSQSNDPAATDKLFEIAKTDKDVELRKKALFWLGQRNDPRVQKLLLDIINQD